MPDPIDRADVLRIVSAMPEYLSTSAMIELRDRIAALPTLAPPGPAVSEESSLRAERDAALAKLAEAQRQISVGYGEANFNASRAEQAEAELAGAHREIEFQRGLMIVYSDGVPLSQGDFDAWQNRHRDLEAELSRLRADAARLRAALTTLADAAETFAGSDPDMPSHGDNESDFDSALDAARAALAKDASDVP